MQQHDLKPSEGAHRERKRVGRGISAGQGKTAGKGTKGQKARSGPGVRRGFEGGQNPIYMRMPYKRGFTNIFKQPFAVVNVERLEELFEAGDEITPEVLVARRLVPDKVLRAAGRPVQGLAGENPRRWRDHEAAHGARASRDGDRAREDHRGGRTVERRTGRRKADEAAEETA